MSISVGRPKTGESASNGEIGGAVLDKAVQRMMAAEERLSVVLRACVTLVCTELRHGSEGKQGNTVAVSLCGSRLAAMALALDQSSFSDFELAIDQYTMADRWVREKFYNDGGLQFVTGALSGTSLYALNAQALQGMRECCAHVLGSLASAGTVSFSYVCRCSVHVRCCFAPFRCNAHEFCARDEPES